MKTVVRVSGIEVARIVALAVLGRPENAGRATAGVEVALVGNELDVQVVVCDTLEEVREHNEAMRSAAAPAQTAQVLQLVQPLKPEFKACEQCGNREACEIAGCRLELEHRRAMHDRTFDWRPSPEVPT